MSKTRSLPCLLGWAITAAACVVPAGAIASPTCEPVLRLDSRGVPLDGETVLRAETARSVACERKRRSPDHRAIARYTKLYLDHARTPACELMLIDARANIQIAGQRSGRRARRFQSTSERQWRRAWDLLSAIFLAWENGPRSLARQPALDRCVRPARDLLSQFPSVTVTIEPEDASGYKLFWDGIARAASLPSILPGRHMLDVEAPEGHTASLSVDDEAVIRRHQQVVHRDLDLRWAQRMRIKITFEPLAAGLQGRRCGPRAGGRRQHTICATGE